MSTFTVLFTLLFTAQLIPNPSADCSLNEEFKQSSAQLPDHVNIILIGATGDLAKKYLWRALYDLYHDNYDKGKVHFNIFGAARTSQDEGNS